MRGGGRTAGGVPRGGAGFQEGVMNFISLPCACNTKTIFTPKQTAFLRDGTVVGA